MTAYRKLAFSVYASKCDECGFPGSPDNRLEVHHRDEDRSNNDIGNLQILCRDCHRFLHFGFMDAMKRSISFRTDQIVAIRQIAKEDGHRNFSRVVQEAVDRELERRMSLDEIKEQAA